MNRILQDARYALRTLGRTPGFALVLAYAALMLGACLLACIVPTRRAL